MKHVKLHLKEPFQGPARKCKVPFEGADHAVAEGYCPHCMVTPLKVAGVKGTMAKGHDTYTSDGGCLACNTVLGKLVVTVNTLFGIEEDERVLAGRCRVY